MSATREDVNRWIDKAKQEDYSYIISVCDTFEYDDYPVYCKTIEDVKDKYSKYDNNNMQRINEVIRINDDGTVDENLNINLI